MVRELIHDETFLAQKADLSGYSDSMRPLILKDIMAALQKMGGMDVEGPSAPKNVDRNGG